MHRCTSELDHHLTIGIKLLPMLVLGWELLSQFSPFRYFPHFPLLSKQTLAIEFHVYIWQVLPQLSCGDTCQIWMWFRESNRYFCKIENFAYGEISERSLSNPHPWFIVNRTLRNTSGKFESKYNHFHLRKMNVKTSFAKWWPLCVGIDVLRHS